MLLIDELEENRPITMIIMNIVYVRERGGVGVEGLGLLRKVDICRSYFHLIDEQKYF